MRKDEKRQGMTVAGYARHRDVTVGCITTAKRSGRLVLYEDGSINAEASDALRDGRPGRKPTVSGGMTLAQAKTAREVALAEKARIEVDALSGTLIRVDKVKAAFFRWSREQRDAWVNWPSRIAGLMAADLDIEETALLAALDKAVFEHLDEIANSRFALDGDETG